MKDDKIMKFLLNDNIHLARKPPKECPSRIISEIFIASRQRSMLSTNFVKVIEYKNPDKYSYLYLILDFNRVARESRSRTSTEP